MGLFDHIPDADARPTAGLFDHIPDDAPPVSTVVDVAKGVGAGYLRGVASLAGLPASAARLYQWAYDQGQARLTKRPYDEVRDENDKSRAIPTTTVDRALPDALLGYVQQGHDAIKGDAGPLYEPQTRVGKFAGSVASFLPGAAGAGGLAGNIGKFAVAPGIASEAAGELTEGTKLEPWARAAAGLGVGGGAMYMTRRSAAQSTAARGLQEIPHEQIDDILTRAQALLDEAQSRGVPLSSASAIDTASKGLTGLSELQRQVEGHGRMRQFYADMPGKVDTAARGAFDAVAPAADAGELGDQVRTAARQAVDGTPEAQRVAASVEAAGPRITPEAAGQAMQPELAGIHDARVGARAAQANADYGAARRSGSHVPIEERMIEVERPPYGGAEMPTLTPQEREGYRGQVIRALMRDGRPTEAIDPGRVDLAVNALARGVEFDPVAAYDSGPQWANPTRVQVPQTRYGQVNPGSVVQHIDEQLQHAKGGTQSALQAVRRMMFEPGGVEGSVEGLHNARTSIDELMAKAQANEQPNAVRVLQGVKDHLDAALEQVPEYAAGNANFRANSAPLAPFDTTPAMAGTVARDRFNQRLTMPPEKVPGAFDQGGSSASRALNEVPASAAQAAYRQHLTTRLLDGATDTSGRISADRLRTALRDNADVLAQHPQVRDRLQAIATARDGMSRIEDTILGRIAEHQPDVGAAARALFPENPVAGNTDAISSTLSALSARSPWAARQLVRTHAETVFNEATQAVKGVRPDSGGASFASALRGNPEQAKNLEAAVRALPEGDTLWNGFDRFLDVLEAGGRRQSIGSKTEYNRQFTAEAKRGGPLEAAGAVAATGLVKLPAKMMAKLEDWRLGRNVDELANLFASPDAAGAFRGLLKAENPSGPVGRLIAIGTTARRGGHAGGQD